MKLVKLSIFCKITVYLSTISCTNTVTLQKEGKPETLRTADTQNPATTPDTDPAVDPTTDPAADPVADSDAGPHDTSSPPNLSLPEPPQGKWAFNPPTDTFSPESVLDLRSLNEVTAGEHGFIGLSKDGRDFARGDGKPIRFWAINSYIWQNGTMPDIEEHGRFLAKRGVNMVRYHGNVVSKVEGSKLTDIDADEREKLWRLVAGMKKSGIYVTMSPYYPHATKALTSWGVPRNGKNMAGLLFFDSTLQNAYKEWLRALMVPKNPHTGLALKDDPALAIIQIQNEDSLLFWTSQSIAGADLALLEAAYSKWLIGKYGSIDAAKTNWGNATLPADSSERMGLYIVWEMTQEQTGAKAKRLADQTEFWVETMHKFNGEIVRFLREDLGAKQLVNAGNWKTADPLRLEDAERFSYTSSEVIGVNRYYGGGTHNGPHKVWAIVNGDTFDNLSVLTNPREFPLNLRHVSKHPMIISESNWVPPLGYQSEGPFLVAAFQSLTGMDGFYWFATKEKQWRQPSSANGFLPSLGKWVTATPEIMGNFPASALMYRRNDLKSGVGAVIEQRRLSDLWNRTVPIIAEGRSFDPNRDSSFISSESNVQEGLDPLAFLVGGIEVNFSNESHASEVVDLTPLIDEDAKTVRSVTQEIVWNHQDGVCTINAPRVQGATGFLAQNGPIELRDVTLAVSNPYATITVISLDESRIELAKQIFIQSGTIARPTNWQERTINKDGKSVVEIVNYGKAPWQMPHNAARIAVRNSLVTKGVALDMNGVRTGEFPIERQGAWVVLDLPRDGKYFLLE